MTPAEKAAMQKPPRRPRDSGPAAPRPLVWVCSLRGRRVALGLSVRDVAVGAGLSLSTVVGAERGHDTSLDSARRLAAFFGCTVEEAWPRRLADPEPPAEPAR